MLNLKGHEENGVVILDEPQSINLGILQKEYAGGACLIDIDGDLDDNCCMKIYAYCDRNNVDNLNEYRDRTPNRYALLLINGVYTV